nr:MAG TPA: hypothetical protein [Caudoviricetes sp.]
MFFTYIVNLKKIKKNNFFQKKPAISLQVIFFLRTFAPFT